MPLRTAQVDDTVQYRNQDGETQNALITGVQGVAPATPTSSLTAGGSLAASTTYGYKMTYVKNGVESPTSAEKTQTTTVTDLTVRLDWTAVVGATSYKIYGRTATTGPWGLLGTTSALTFSDNGSVTPGASGPGADGRVGFKGAHDRVVRSTVLKATGVKDTDRYFLR